jgi:hypothetical protein
MDDVIYERIIFITVDIREMHFRLDSTGSG